MLCEIPQCPSPMSHNPPFCNKNVLTLLLQSGALWDIWLIHNGICEMGRFSASWVLWEHTETSTNQSVSMTFGLRRDSLAWSRSRYGIANGIWRSLCILYYAIYITLQWRRMSAIASQIAGKFIFFSTVYNKASITKISKLRITGSIWKETTCDWWFPAQRWHKGPVLLETIPYSNVHGANRGPTWVLSAPDGPYVGPMNLAIRDAMPSSYTISQRSNNSSPKCLHREVFLMIYEIPNGQIFPYMNMEMKIPWLHSNNQNGTKWTAHTNPWISVHRSLIKLSLFKVD